MAKYAYGQQPSDLGEKDLSLGWLSGVRHLRMNAAGESFWHSHREMQLLYCIKGEFGYEFGDGSAETLTAGHWIVIPARLKHRHVQAIDPAGHRVEMLAKVPRSKGAYATFPPAVAKSLVASLLREPCRACAASRELDAVFRRLDDLAERGAKDLSPEELALARTLASLAFQSCAGADDAVARRAKPEARLMDEATAWLKGHFAENVRMKSLVEYMGYSRSRLFDLFREHTGLSPADYLARYRIKVARRMLAQTDRKVSDVAKACGFASAQSFNPAFRRQTGLTPSGWRKKSCSTRS